MQPTDLEALGRAQTEARMRDYRRRARWDLAAPDMQSALFSVRNFMDAYWEQLTVGVDDHMRDRVLAVRAEVVEVLTAATGENIE